MAWQRKNRKLHQNHRALFGAAKNKGFSMQAEKETSETKAMTATRPALVFPSLNGISERHLMKKMFVGLVALGCSMVASAATDDAKAAYKASNESAAETYKLARVKCDALSGNPKDVCIEEAKAAAKSSKAEAKGKYKNTPRAHMKAQIAMADADYAVAKEKCKAQSGNAKDLCIKQATAARTKAIVDAKSSKTIGDVKTEAAEDKRDADYSVAVEKCKSMAGPAKDACFAMTNSKYGK
jgi:uncharacterized protein (UPF0371 family)